MSAPQLEAAAAVLGPLVDEVVFVGGATVHLWITEPGAPPTRATDDVDVICEVATRVEYHRLGEMLRERGLREAMDEPVICRWRSADPSIVLDVMRPGDMLASLDVHDVLTLIDGRPELVEEVRSARPDLRDYIRAELSTLRAGPYFDYAVDGATAGYGPVGTERARLVRDRIAELLA
jgi:hypothetical protein